MELTFVGASDEQARWNSCQDPRKFLEVGKKYKLVRKEVHSWHTRVFLEGFEDIPFNSVCFNPIVSVD